MYNLLYLWRNARFCGEKTVNFDSDHEKSSNCSAYL